ncbi:hypothetical protein NW752_003438 [Fusarium irregulare]|uniref:DUF7600 domain-containing protein n=1 Tax=Fusarium irregulare TaxID=2494466 RepID=A0A9W8UBG6_9HYPO|nr:hypothetical protein NW766_004508 [Fusarium irregulare]KAJ4022982.1 hypothetical protein NW752_003438 [Fusarium irregulare]
MTCVICGIPIQRTDTEDDGFNGKSQRDWPQDCRAVYVFDWDLANIKISGLGVRVLNDDILVPVDPSKRYDGSINQELIGVSEHWGFVLHDACWGLLCEGFQLDLNHLFLFYLSTYIGHCGLPCWNGDYGGVAQIGTNGQVILWGPIFDHDVDDDVPAEYKIYPFQIPTLKKAITFSNRLQQDAFHSKLDPQKLSLDKDIFSHLPTEIAETIVTLLPSPDVHSLHLALPVFATLTLSERFWASRFRKGREVEFIPDVVNNPPTSWRALYLSLHVWASDNLGMINRRRVWKLVDNIQSVLCHIRDTTCFGTVSNSLLDPQAPDNYVQVAEGYSWITAERTAEESNFRNLRYRTLSFPGPIQITQVSVSMFDTPDGRYVSGLTFIDHDGQVAPLGYCHPRHIVHIELPGAQHIQGWEVVHDLQGVKAIAVVAQDDTVSRFAGSPGGNPHKLLVSSEGVSSIRATFDCLWNCTSERLQSSRSFKFVDERSREHWQKLGNVHPLVSRQWDTQFGETEVRNYFIDLDSDHGEEITGLDVQMYSGLVCGLKVHTNFGRTTNLTSKRSPILGEPAFPWVSIRPRGNKIIGMYMVGGGFSEALFAEIGLISVDE